MTDKRAVMHELMGRPDEARHIRETFATGGREGYLRELIRFKLVKNPNGLWMPAASAYALLGDKEKAIAALESAAKKGEFWLFQIRDRKSTRLNSSH